MTKKILSVLLVLAMLFTACACGGNTNNANNATKEQEELEAYRREFAAFVDEQYKHSIEESYSTLHIYYLDPEAAGLDMSKVDISVGTAPTDAEMQEDRDYYNGLKELLDKMISYDLSSKSRQSRIHFVSSISEIEGLL